MYIMIRNIIFFNLFIELVCDLFDKLVILILVLFCGCDNWGYKDIGIIEKIFLKLLEYVLCLKSIMLFYLIYGVLGWYLIVNIIVYLWMNLYWIRLRLR